MCKDLLTLKKFVPRWFLGFSHQSKKNTTEKFALTCYMSLMPTLTLKKNHLWFPYCVFQYDPETNWGSVLFKTQSSPRMKKAYHSKAMAIMFYYSNGVMLVVWVPNTLLHWSVLHICQICAVFVFPKVKSVFKGTQVREENTYFIKVKLLYLWQKALSLRPVGNKSASVWMVIILKGISM